MKSYPSIDKIVRSGVKLHVWDKLDGSNIRAEWNKKQGFYKFGSRTQLIGPDHPSLGGSIELISDTYAGDLARIFKDERWERAVAFFEYHSPNSFAGTHVDEPHEVTILDVDVFKQGLLPQSTFMHLFSDLKLPKLLHVGQIDADFCELVRTGQLPDMTFEGVVCKGEIDRKTKLPVMFKVKNQAWLDRLRAIVKDDAEFERLS